VGQLVGAPVLEGGSGGTGTVLAPVVVGVLLALLVGLLVVPRGGFVEPVAGADDDDERVGVLLEVGDRVVVAVDVRVREVVRVLEVVCWTWAAPAPVPPSPPAVPTWADGGRT
jgi:hypothetical protein